MGGEHFESVAGWKLASTTISHKTEKFKFSKFKFKWEEMGGNTILNNHSVMIQGVQFMLVGNGEVHVDKMCSQWWTHYLNIWYLHFLKKNKGEQMRALCGLIF